MLQAGVDLLLLLLPRRFRLQACGRVFPPYSLAAPPPARSCRPAHVDIDMEDRDDPMACTTYVNDIFEYLRESEVRQASMWGWPFNFFERGCCGSC